ncbi:MAG TPA: hypothetical protein VGD69_06325 [Herpetosiphonaceae bacterium]
MDNHLFDDLDDEPAALTVSRLIAMYQSPQPDIDEVFLAGMTDIHWADLMHAHGAATDVPPLLRALLSHDPDHRDFALKLLFETIWHQGTVYQASAYAVPLLTRLLVHPETPNKPGIIYLLASLADGHSYLAVHERTEADIADARERLARHGLDFETELHKELGWVQQSRAAVLAGVPTFLQLLDDDDREVQAFARYILSLLPEAASASIPRLVDRMPNDDDTLRGHTLLALDALLPIAPSAVDVFEHAYDHERNPTLRTLAALALLKRQGTSAPAAIVETLIQASQVLDTNPDYRYDAWMVDARFYPAPWGLDRAEDIAGAFAACDSATGAQHFLAALAGVRNNDVAHIFVARLLDLVFHGQRAEVRGATYSMRDGRDVIEYRIRQPIPPRQRTTLDPNQEAALTAIVQHTLFWTTDTNLLELYGLPSTRGSLQEWLFQSRSG